MRMTQREFKRKKRVHGNPFPKTRGNGISYVEKPQAPKLSPEEFTCREIGRQHVATLDARRDSHINILMQFAEQALSTWKIESERRDQRLRDFTGWAATSFCTLPVDEEVAELYEDEFFDYANHHWGRALSIADRDKIVEHAFRQGFSVSDSQITAALDNVRDAARISADEFGINTDLFVNIIRGRSKRLMTDDIYVGTALQPIVRRYKSLEAA